MEQIILKDLVERVIPGVTPRDLKDPNGTPCEIININNLGYGKIDTQSLEQCNFSPGKQRGYRIESYALAEGDVIISTRGTNIRAAMIDFPTHNRFISQNLAAFRVNSRILPQVVVIYLKSQQGQHELKLISREGSCPFVYVRDVLQLEIPVPSPELQKKIVSYCDTVEDYLSYLKKEVIITRDIQRHMIDSALEVSL